MTDTDKLIERLREKKITSEYLDEPVVRLSDAEQIIHEWEGEQDGTKGWVSIGRIKIDVENETETFERMQPPSPAPLGEDAIAALRELGLPHANAVLVAQNIADLEQQLTESERRRVEAIANAEAEENCLSDVCFDLRDKIAALESRLAEAHLLGSLHCGVVICEAHDDKEIRQQVIAEAQQEQGK